jgi:hypothetical protein
MTVSDADGGGMSARFGGAAGARDECDVDVGCGAVHRIEEFYGMTPCFL